MQEVWQPMKFKVTEVFLSIEGEGIRTGYPAIFVRLYGCNLSCSYCDNSYACKGEGYTLMNTDEVIRIVSRYRPTNRITITGGEPLLAKDLSGLCEKLVALGYEINIETNGSLPIDKYLSIPNVILTMDYKCTLSGMRHMMELANLKLLREHDVLKFVVGSEEDLDNMKDILSIANVKSHLFVSPVFNNITAAEIVDYILRHNLTKVRVQLQLHKYIWDPNKRGV